MAKKGQKFQKHSPQLRAEILQKYLNSEGSAASLAKEYGISNKTIETWVAKYKHGKDIFEDHRKGNSGRKKAVEIDYKERYEILKKFQAFVEAQREKK